MNELSILLTLGTVHFIALMSPGPDFALVFQNATRFGRPTGLAIALGLSISILFHTVLSITGISVLVHQHPTLFLAIQFAGGSFLIWLGLNALYSLRKKRDSEPQAKAPDQTLSSANRLSALIKGMLTNLFNPKALVFFVSLMSSLVPVGMSAQGKITAVILVFLLSLGWFSALAWLLSGKQVQARLTRYTPWIDGACGLVFCLLGAGVITRALS